MNNYEKEKLVGDCTEAVDHLRKANGRVENMLGFLKTESLEDHDAVDELNIKMIETARSQLSKPLAQLSAFAILLENIETTERVLAPNTPQANPAGRPGTASDSETGHRATDKEPGETARPVLAPEQPAIESLGRAPAKLEPVPVPEAWPAQRTVYSTDNERELEKYTVEFDFSSKIEADEIGNPDSDLDGYWVSPVMRNNRVHVSAKGSDPTNTISLGNCSFINILVNSRHSVMVLAHTDSETKRLGDLDPDRVLYPKSLDQLISFIERWGGGTMGLKHIDLLRTRVRTITRDHRRICADAERRENDPDRLRTPRMVAYP